VEERGQVEMDPHDKTLRRITRERKENEYLKEFIK